ncbi:MAG: histone deacetylase [Flavobacteriales bacterium]|nr:histone deacetylase [Flavobacteriales bacterium]
MLKIAWSEHYHHPLPEGHRFPMEKYTLLPEQLRYEGTADESHFHAPKPISEEVILRTHDPVYWQRLRDGELTPKEQRKTGFPHSPSLVERERVISQGTVDIANHALEHGCGLNVAGGTHHAYTDRGEGFCLLNDLAIAANWLLKTNKIMTRPSRADAGAPVLIFDLDVHQGNGTAQIFRNDPNVYTFSMHGANNYPLHKETSDRDVALDDNTPDEVFLKILQKELHETLDRVRPGFVFYLAGVDVLATDKLGRLGLSLDGCKRRDEIVISKLSQLGLPCAIAMGGGYSERIADIVEAHANTFRLAKFYYE